MNRKYKYMKGLISASIISLLIISFAYINPSEAANTASEDLTEDTDEPARRFAGKNRYQTSHSLAEAYIEESEDIVDTILIASGDTMLDAAASYGLSASYNAPILLTPQHRMNGSILRFIEEYDISKAIILGEHEAVGDEAMKTLSDLERMKVDRLGGIDRYETSVIMARNTASANSFCGSELPGAIILNVDHSFSDSISIGPLAYALNIPILLTKADDLPVVVVDFLDETDIEEIMIVGGTTSVSPRIEREVQEIGDNRVFRVAGDDRYATSVEIAKIIKECQELGILPESNTEDQAIVEQIALVNGDAVPDGIASGPIMGGGLGGDAVIPILITDGESIDDSVEEFLEEIPERTEDSIPIDVEIIPVGGEDVIPAVVVETALSHVVTSSPIQAVIHGLPFYRIMDITFSDPVDPSTATDSRNYLLNGKSLLSTDTVTYSGDVVTIIFPVGFALSVGDVIEVVGGKIKGARGDHRLVEHTSFTVQEPEYSLAKAPKVKILAAENAYEFRIQILDDDFRSDLTDFNVGSVSLNGATLESATGESNGASFIPNLLSADDSRSVLICLFGNTGNDCDTSPLVGDDDPKTTKSLLKTGDIIEVRKGIFEDRLGNRSKAARHKIKSSKGEAPRVVKILLSDPTGYEAANIEYNAKLEWALYDAASGGNLVENYLTIEARIDAEETTGALGNKWKVEWSQLEGVNNGQHEISINVSPSRQALLISYDEDTTLYNLAHALGRHPDVSSLFNISSDALTDSNFKEIRLDGLLERTEESMERDKPSLTSFNMVGGRSVMHLTLRHNQVIRSFITTDATTGFEDNNGELLLNSNFTTWFAPSPLISVEDVIYRIVGKNFDRLPKEGDTIILPEGMLSGYLTSTDSSALTNADNFLISVSNPRFEIE